MLTLSLALEKSAYAVGERIIGTVVLRNCGAASVRVNARLAWNVECAPPQCREIRFIVRDEAGREVPCRMFVNVGAPRNADVIELQAGEAVEKQYELTRGYRLVRLGAYSVQAVYENLSAWEEPGPKPWKGRLASNVVRITIGRHLL
ncbi:hypothetical protein [Limisphaera sp. VF-2]|jgi:hypothetical protein|uniref:hypothetical protein n=1 Tax=Limisphaera sp. VF-2 TaxID=3400418 RepID=UPI003C29D391